jgi:ketosteroid isomerase-like protein
VELIQAAFTAFARADVAYILDASDPHIEVVESPDLLLDPSTYHGRQGLLAALAHWSDEWEGLSVDVERIVGVGDRVVSLVLHRARGKSSGAPVELHMAYVHTLKNRKVVRWEVFATWAQALEAAGLTE